ncbi:MAG TPA: ferric reductase-like transmembrane domain-containing protein [Gaiellaceae bacterium]|nr:ferric reductase-like transmembrane domain-containing protein [Gaiellaceae bacterium]
MTTLAARGVIWIALYVGVAVAPLVFALIGVARPGQGFLTDFSVALGFVGLAMIGLQFVLSARFTPVAAPFGMDALLQFHRQMSYTALAFVYLHPALLVVADRDTLGLLNPLKAPWRARMAVAALVALTLLVASSAWRKRLRLSYERWQSLHGLLAVAAVVGSLAHVFLVDYYVDTRWKEGLWLFMSAAFVSLLVWVRLLKPLQLRTRPWEIERVALERGDTTTITLRPRGHDGIRFEPGQFAWFAFARTPFAITKHPFSFSSSAENAGRIAVSVKARGDFTRSVGGLEPGDLAYVEGPYGVLSIDRLEGPGFVFIAGGVGITPIISMLRTMAEREDLRPAILIYANGEWDAVTFREELDELVQTLNLRVVHVLERPPDGWAGETGYVTAELLQRHLPSQYRRYQFFVCGPVPMIAAVERALEALRVSGERVHSERFDLV